MILYLDTFLIDIWELYLYAIVMILEALQIFYIHC